MSTDLIRWEPREVEEGSSYGFAGSRSEPAFQVTPPDRSDGETHWMLLAFLAPTSLHRFGETEAEAKQQAETWLREFTSSLGALFATDLREHLTEQAAIQQELGDGHDEMGHNIAPREHWAKAEALRDLIKHLDRELETR